MESFFNLLISISTTMSVLAISPDPLGYILYCPCMGRFGNQVDQFLGSLAFAYSLNRTLVLPPWVEYRYGEARSVQVPFKTYFKIEELEKYHKVLPMEDFMASIAEVVWPKLKRISFCYVSRGQQNNCNAKEGNPFGPFWDTFNVDFVGNEFYSPLQYDTNNQNMMNEWQRRYPAHIWPVLAFTGAPSSFPVQEHNKDLQKYLKWSTDIQDTVDQFIKENMPNGTFVGIHLRNGIDWVRACSHIPQSPYLFAAPQCLGYDKDSNSAVATEDMCLPSRESVMRQVKRTVRKYNQRGKEEYIINSVFVASDGNHLLHELTAALNNNKIRVLRYSRNNTRVDKPHIDLAVLGRSRHFIGNCISSFSAFVKRERDVNGFPSTFWGFPSETETTNLQHDEL